MKTLHSFLKLVEIRTKVASMFPLAMGTLLVIYLYESFDAINFLLMFMSLICIDLATTGFNHYFDYKRAILKSGYHYQHHNPISSGELSASKSLFLLISLVVFGALAGVLLAYRTDIVVLLLGALSFAIGISYSVGPLPISRTILGELFSGGFMGLLIPFIAFYIHVPNGQLWAISMNSNYATVTISIQTIIPVLLASIPMAFHIANIMLANNICDVEEDIQNLRYTLPVSIGVKRSLVLFKILVLSSYIVVAFAILTRYLPVAFGLSFLSIPVILKQTKHFALNPKKSVTFKLAVKNFLIYSLFSIFGMAVAILMK